MSIRVRRSVLPAQQASVLAEANLRTLERPVLQAVKGRLFRENIHLPLPDLEAAYNHAWHGVCQMVAQGEEIESLTGLLIKITWQRSIDAYRQRNEAQHTDATLDDHAHHVDLAEQVDDQHKINRLIERLVKRLNDKERNAVALCTLHGYTRREAANRLGIPEPALQKIMDSATRKMWSVVAGINARGCGDDEWARALRSFALGLTSEDSPDYPRISKHIEECEVCKRYVMCLRGLAAVLPPLVPFGHDITGLLAHIHRIFAPGRAMTGGPAAQTSTALANGASNASGAGLVGVLGGGTAKTVAVVAAGLVVAGGAVAVQVSAHKHPIAPATAVVHAHSSVSLFTPLLAPVSREASTRHGSPVQKRRHRRRARARAHHRHRPTVVVEEEVGTTSAFESQPPASPPPSSTESSPPQEEKQGGGEFEFER